MEGIYCPGPCEEQQETCADTGVREVVIGSQSKDHKIRDWCKICRERRDRSKHVLAAGQE